MDMNCLSIFFTLTYEMKKSVPDDSFFFISHLVTLQMLLLPVVLLGTRFLRVWPKKVFFHEFLWFWQFFHKFLLFFMILTVFSQISPIFHKFIACQLKFVKNGRNSWKTVKIMKNRRNLWKNCQNQRNSWKNTFLGQTRRNLSPQQSNNLKNLKNLTNLRKSQKISKISKISKNLK